MQPHYTPDGNPIPNSSGIYRITCTVTEKFYIGSGINLCNRWRQHYQALLRKNHPNRYLQRAWDKHGEGCFTFEIIELVLPSFLLEREQYWIDKTDAVEKGFNISPTAGSNFGMKATPETIEKLRISHLGQPGYWTGKKRDPEMVARANAKKRGKPSPRYPGYTPSPEHREKIRQTLTGYKHTEEAKRNMGNSHRGKPANPEGVKKSSIARTGRKNTPEAIDGMIEAHAKEMKTVILIGPDGNQHAITGIHQFCKEHHLDRRSIQRVIKGELGQYKGWRAFNANTN